MNKIIFSLIMFFVFNCFSYAQNETDIKLLNKLIELQKDLHGIHPALNKLYPIAIYKDSSFSIYEFSNEQQSYVLVKITPALREITRGIRAAFMLEENEYKMTCVLTSDAFETLQDYSVIFHEFVHCYQSETIEYKLKDNLSIYKKEMEANNFMWELFYDFPYKNDEIKIIYSQFIENLDNKNLDEAQKLHDLLSEKLSDYQFQYLCWVEWKEGSARWIENMIRLKLNINENIAGKKNELNRTSFYYGGSNFIKLLSKKHLTTNLEDIFGLIHK